ncbi:PQQ-binding-like beta-propeller repeat protein [Schlesneria sp. DSM 10557]|uniref:PQQ-binding-like beta-propeller repeat protein n=1 Tax=Schlesneria sp. DSM 10557 TaxID=3044399 RepID=UPI00359F60A3
MPRLLVAFSLLVFCGLLHSASDAAEPKSSKDWPQWRGEKGDNISPFKGIAKDWEATPPELLWQLEGMGQGYASVSIVGDRLYTTGNIGDSQAVVAVDLKTRAVAWTAPLTDSVPKHGYDGSRCTPTVDGDRLYVITSNGQISCLKVADGSVVWSKNFEKEWNGRMMSGWGFSESPLVDGKHVLCTPGSEEAMIVCLNKVNGKEVWRSAVPDAGEKGSPGAGYSVMTISNGAGVKQYVQLIGRGLIGVRASDGKHLWSYNKIANGVADIPTPIVSGDYVFGSTGYDDGGSALLKLKRSGKGVEAVEQYSRAAKQLQNHHGGMVLMGEHLYFGNGHNNGFPICVDLISGDVKWGGKLRGVGQGSAAITAVDGHLIFRYQSGEVALIEATPNEYKLKGSFMPVYQERESWAQPVVADGKLYLREQNTLMCYDIAEKK